MVFLINLKDINDSAIFLKSLAPRDKVDLINNNNIFIVIFSYFQSFYTPCFGKIEIEGTYFAYIHTVL